MSDNWMFASQLYVGITVLAVLVYLVWKQKFTATRFGRFLGVLTIGLVCAGIPWGFVSMVLGAPSVVLASILVSCLLDKETPSRSL